MPNLKLLNRAEGGGSRGYEGAQAAACLAIVALAVPFFNRKSFCGRVVSFGCNAISTWA